MTKRRPYRLKVRAERQAQTRRRIVEATIELHQALGPATTVSEIARRVGVERRTVYNHFPDQASLVRACVGHWSAENPMPDPTAWSEPTDPKQRLLAGLHAFYAYYRNTQGLWRRALADADTVPIVGELLEGPHYHEHIDNTARALARRLGLRGKRRTRAPTTIGLALQFPTWRYLTQRQELGDEAAAQVMADAALVAARTSPRSSG